MFNINSNNSNNQNGEITIPYKIYKEAIESSSTTTKYLITQANYKGVAEPNENRLSCEFSIKVFTDERCAIQLISQRATIESTSITYIDNSSDHQNHSGDSVGSCIITSSSFYHLYTCKAGRYNIKLNVFVPFITAKKTGMELMIPSSSNNSISFQVPQSNTNIKIFNSVPDVDATEEYERKTAKDTGNNNYTIIFAKLPLENNLRIQWTIKSENSVSINQTADQKLKVKPSVIVFQNTLGSIGEGLLTLKSQFNYRIVAGIISLFNLTVEKNVNIISVDGEAIKKWEVVDVVEKSSDSRLTTTTRMLQVYLDYGVENSYDLNVSAEYNMGDTSADVGIPITICKGEEITRHRGFMAIEARTNVEISEIGSNSVDIVDIQEIPPQLSRMASHPILFAYKFLDPNFTLNLRVKKNLDVQVLVSICESAHFITTVSYTGRTIHQYILSIKNTQKQFLRIQVPFAYNLWSTLMDGKPILPSLKSNDEDNNNNNNHEQILLIPLLKPVGYKPLPGQDETSVQIEIVLLEKEVKNVKPNSGTLTFTMPKIDVALRAAYCTIYLPGNFQCNKFHGNLKKTTHFSSNPPRPITNPGAPMEEQQQQAYGGSSYDSDDDDDYDRISTTRNSLGRILTREASLERMEVNDEYMASSFQKNSKNISKSFGFASKAGGKSRKPGCGVIPVRVEMPITNNSFLFEQILLSGDNDLSVSFLYKQQKEKVR